MFNNKKTLLSFLPIYLFLALSVTSCSNSRIWSLGSKGKSIAQGIDVSEYQGDINWQVSKTSNIDFAYARASEGIDIKDDKFKKNWEGIKDAGILRGAYHFFIFGDSPQEQVKNFLYQFSLEKGDLAPMIDIEPGSLIKGRKFSKQLLKEDLLFTLELIEKNTKCSPIIYTNYSFGNTYLTDTRFSKYKLWIADYDVNEPNIPNTWKKKNWFIWQYSIKKNFAGVTSKGGKVDQNKSRLNKENFKKLLICL